MITNETLKIIKQRRSIRSFKDEQIKEEELQAVLEAGLYAPYAWDQAWHFTVLKATGGFPIARFYQGHSLMNVSRSLAFRQ